VYGKTGSLGGVKSLSGYLTTQHGDQIAFAILTNNFNTPAKKVTDAIDDIILNVVDDEGRRK
jgi:serine-type D-Ala-D-Ala carboxypeptidase/endopeptidase (penicillin-binding protein 4)